LHAFTYQKASVIAQWWQRQPDHVQSLPQPFQSEQV